MTSESTSWIGQQLWAQYGFSSTTYGIDVQRRPGYWVNLQRPKSVLTILLRQSDKTRWQQRILRPTSVHLHQNKQWNWPPTASSGSSRFRSLLEPTGGACVGHPEDVMMIQKEVCTGKTSQMNHTYGKREQLISIRSLPNWWDKQQGLPTVSSNVWVHRSWCHRRSRQRKVPCSSIDMKYLHYKFWLLDDVYDTVSTWYRQWVFKCQETISNSKRTVEIFLELLVDMGQWNNQIFWARFPENLKSYTYFSQIYWVRI
jgi:hypothetical protein